MTKKRRSKGKHSLFVYDSKEEFLRRMEDLVLAALHRGEVIVFLAPAKDLTILEERLTAAGVDVSAERAKGNYHPFGAETLLDELLINEWPCEERFNAFVEKLSSLAGDRKVRVVGEVGALLLERKLPMVTVALEELWRGAIEECGFDLSCAYPEEAFRNHQPCFHAICAAHSDIVRGL
jgi:hypothetical protein